MIIEIENLLNGWKNLYNKEWYKEYYPYPPDIVESLGKAIIGKIKIVSYESRSDLFPDKSLEGTINETLKFLEDEFHKHKESTPFGYSYTFSRNYEVKYQLYRKKNVEKHYITANYEEHGFYKARYSTGHISDILRNPKVKLIFYTKKGEKIYTKYGEDTDDYVKRIFSTPPGGF